MNVDGANNWCLFLGSFYLLMGGKSLSDALLKLSMMQKSGRPFIFLSPDAHHLLCRNMGTVACV